MADFAGIYFRDLVKKIAKPRNFFLTGANTNTVIAKKIRSYVKSVEISILLSGTMEMVAGMRRQILAQLRSLGLIRQRGPGDIKDLNSNSRNWAVIKAVVGAGLYPNIIKVLLFTIFPLLGMHSKTKSRTAILIRHISAESRQ